MKAKLYKLKSALPKAVRNGDYIARTFRPFLNYFPNSFMCKFTKGMSYITLSNPTGKALNLKGGTCIGSITFETVQNLNAEKNYIRHYHVDLDRGIAFCRCSKDKCPIVNCKPQQDGIAHGSQTGLSMRNASQYKRKANVSDVTDDEVSSYDLVMRDYYSHDQDNMTTAEIYALKCKTFPYLEKSDVRLKMSDRVIIEKELDFVTDSVLSEADRVKVKDFYYLCRECLSTHDNTCIQNKTYVSLKPINLKPFYIQRFCLFLFLFLNF